MVANWELDFTEGAFDLGHRAAQITSGQVSLDVNPAGQIFSIDGVRNRHHADIGHLRQGHLPAAGRLKVNRQPAKTGQAIAVVGRAPDIDIVGPVVGVNVARFFAGHHIGRRPTNIARFESILVGPDQVHLNFHLGYVYQKLHMLISETLDR